MRRIGCSPIRLLLPVAALALLMLAGCRSPYVQTTIVNSGTTELHNIEVDYPSASFGLPSLEPQAEFHYRFMIRDAGRMKVIFVDAAQHSHTGKGPYVAQGQQGTLRIALDGSGKNNWTVNLKPIVATPKGE